MLSFIAFRCKTDPTVEDHPSTNTAHRMSYESFTFVGMDDPITYLQCDTLVCDNQAPDRRCRDRKCIEDNVRRRRKRHHNDLSDFSGFRILSRPLRVKLHHRQRRKIRSLEMPEEEYEKPIIHSAGEKLREWSSSFCHTKLSSSNK